MSEQTNKKTKRKRDKMKKKTKIQNDIKQRDKMTKKILIVSRYVSFTLLQCIYAIVSMVQLHGTGNFAINATLYF